MKKCIVIMLSPDVDVRGGIPFVVQEYFKGNLKEKVELIFIPTHKDGSHLKKIGVFFKALFQFLSLAPKMKTSITHFHTSQNGSFVRKFILFIIAKIFGAKTVVHIHGSQFDSFMEKNAVFRSLTKFYFNQANCILVMSSLWLKRLEGFTKNKNIILVYNPVSLLTKGSSQNNAVNILFLGRLGKRKGIYDLLECVNQHKEYFQSKKARFILAGDGDVEQVRQFVNDHDLTNVIEVPGWILSKEKEQYLKTSDILILPSYNEQMPMSILEGMGYGYPIVATNIAGIPEMVTHGENGYLFSPGDIKAMAQALRQLCEDTALRERMGRRSQEIVKEKFQNTKIVDQLVSIYENL